MSGLSTVEAESFLHAFLVFFGSKLSHFDDVYVHGIGVSGFGGSGEGMVGLMGRFRVPFGDFFGSFPLSLEGYGLLVMIFLLFHNLLLLVFSRRVHILFGMCRYDYVSLLLVVHPFHSRMIVL